MLQIIELVTGGWAVFIGIVLFICSLIMQNKEETDQKTRQFRYALLSVIFFQLADMLAWNFSNGRGISSYLMVRLTNFICYIITPMILLNISSFTLSQIPGDNPEAEGYGQTTARKNPNHQLRNPIATVRKIQYILAAIQAFIAILNLFTGTMYTFDDHNRFHLTTGPVTLCYYISCAISILLIHGLAWKYRKTGNKVILHRIRQTCLLNEIIAFIQVILYGYCAFSIGFTIGAVLLFTGSLKQRAELQQEKQLQLEENRRNLAITRQQMLQLQIQPHFIYNTMAAIQAQILENQEGAYESIGIFSSFLRDTIRFSAMDQRIPVEEELSFAEKYLELAELRFGDKLNIDFDIQDTDFSIPAFTLQPLIENALNHGLKPFDHEGTITLRTYRRTEGDREVAVLEVEDNGVGMNPTILNQLRASGSWENEFYGNEQPAIGQQVSSQPNIRLQENSRQQEGTHIGLHNVQQRIEMSCGGHLEVESPVKHRKAEEILPEEVLSLTIQTMIDQTQTPPTTQKTAINRAGTIVRLILPSEETTL